MPMIQPSSELRKCKHSSLRRQQCLHRARYCSFKHPPHSASHGRSDSSLEELRFIATSGVCFGRWLRLWSLGANDLALLGTTELGRPLKRSRLRFIIEAVMRGVRTIAPFLSRRIPAVLGRIEIVLPRRTFCLSIFGLIPYQIL
jgi:hypothetical protein